MAVALVTAALAVLPASGAAVIACGDTITKDVKLKATLDCSAYPGNALEVGGDDVTIDLNRHKLIAQPASDYGINDQGFNRLTVKRGTITGAYHSIELFESNNVTLKRLNLNLQGSNDNYGVYAGELKHLHMKHVNVDNSNYAYYVYSATDVRLSHSKVTGNDPAVTYGVYFGSSSGRTRVEIDDVRVNHADYGMYLYGASKHFTVTDSTANDAGYAGFYFANTLSPHEYTAKRNTANGTGDYGFYAANKVRGRHNVAKNHSVENCVKVRCN
jgi:hypothetical protein